MSSYDRVAPDTGASTQVKAGDAIGDLVGIDDSGQGRSHHRLGVRNGQANELCAGVPSCPMVVPSKWQSLMDTKGFEETVAVHP